MGGFIAFLFSLSVWVTLGLAKQYCTRIFHSAIINNQTLFIDGGEVRYMNNSDQIVKAERNLLSVDLSKSWTNSDADLFTTIAKPSYNASFPNRNPAPLDEGASWSDGSNLYFYGGYISASSGLPKPPPLGTWKYNIQSDQWTNKGFGGVPLVRLIEGATAQSSIHQKAYYLGGVLNPAGNPQDFGTDDAGTYSVGGLLSLDQKTLEWNNLSTSGLNQYETITDGYMNLIENIGDEGILVAFGGNTHPVGQHMSLLAGSQDNTNYHNSMEFISVYDIANDEWYSQQSSGDIPTWRMSGCSVVVPAQDLSSFSIYMFGGMGNTTAETVSDGDVYVLSLPSFRWIRAHSSNNLRIKHKCQLAGKHTMLVTGGTVPRDNREYDPIAVNCDSGTFANGLGIFDLNSHQWRTDWDAKDSEYTISSDISKVIGGGKTGSATLKEPENGFNNTKLDALFQNTHTVSTSSSNSSTTPSASAAGQSNSNSISKGGIAGATIGAVAGAAAIGCIVFFLITYFRRHKLKHDALASNDGDNSRTQARLIELHGEARPFQLAEMDDKANLTEMPVDNTNNNGILHRNELEGDTVAELDGSQART